MKPIYARKQTENGIRRLMLDMAFIATHKQIRLLKYLYEDGLFFPFLPNKKDITKIENFSLTRDKIKKEDKDFFYFDFPFKPEQVEDIAI